MASGITSLQAQNLISNWNTGIEKKIPALVKGARFYKIVGLAGKLTSALLIAVTASITTHFFTTTTEPVSLGLIITVIICSVLVEILIAFDTLANPITKSSNCSISAKTYSDLNRELDTIIMGLEAMPNKEYISPELFQQILYYSAREQNILINEPLLLCFGRKTGKVMKNHQLNMIANNELMQRLEKNKLTQSDKNFIISMINSDAIDEIELEQVV